MATRQRIDLEHVAPKVPVLADAGAGVTEPSTGPARICAMTLLSFCLPHGRCRANPVKEVLGPNAAGVIRVVAERSCELDAFCNSVQTVYAQNQFSALLYQQDEPITSDAFKAC